MEPPRLRMGKSFLFPALHFSKPDPAKERHRSFALGRHIAPSPVVLKGNGLLWFLLCTTGDSEPKGELPVSLNWIGVGRWS